MSYTTEQRRALRQACSVIFPGFSQPSPAEEFRQLAQWCEANDVAHDVYGEGELLSSFERDIAGLLGKEAAVVMPSGMMAQSCALRVWCERAGLWRFGMHPTSHLALREQEAYQALFHCHGVPVGDRLRPMIAGDLDAVGQPLACLLVELPIREAGGQLPDWGDLQALKDLAQRRRIPLHMDGARLWESRAFYGRDFASIAQGFESVYVSLYKGIGAIAGAVLAGDADFIREARLWQRRMGGTLVHQSPMVASAAMRFQSRLAVMDACFARAVILAEALAKIPGLRINPTVPQTNMFHLYMDAPASRIIDRRDEIAAVTGHWVINDARPAAVPGWSYSELYVGDTLERRDNAAVIPYFERLMG